MVGEGGQERRADDTVTTGELGRRLDKLEGKVDRGFEELRDTIVATSSTFLRLDLYLAERDAQRADLEAVKKIAMWALALVCSTVLGAVLLAIISMSGAFAQ